MDNSKLIMEYVEQIKGKYPELRIAQIITLGAMYGGWRKGDVFYCDDEILVHGLERYVQMKK